MDPTQLNAYHNELVDALRAIGNPGYGRAVQKDRGSRMRHLGIRFPELRARVAKGFSFTSLPEDQVLEVWDGLWRMSPYADVLYAAIEFYRPIVRKQVPPGLWEVTQTWHRRVDNWCLADALASIWSRVLESDINTVYPFLDDLNYSESVWDRRLSLVSLIHYSGKNAVFLPWQAVEPLVSRSLEDDRHYVQTAVGWLIREMGDASRREVTAYLVQNSGRLGTEAFNRATERMTPADKGRLRRNR
jgi:3-methyladenine DNA glycosylase AlkD